MSFFLRIGPPPRSTLFPYTTLFRSLHGDHVRSGLESSLEPALGPLESEEVHVARSEEHTSELQSHLNLVCRLLLEKKKDTESAWQRVDGSLRRPALLRPVGRIRPTADPTPPPAQP